MTESILGWLREETFDRYSLMAEILRLKGYEDRPMPWFNILVWSIATMMILLASWKIITSLLAWYKKPSDCPQKLFRKLVQKHGLSASETRLIYQLASSIPGSLPSSILFVDPSLWKAGDASPNDIEVHRRLFQKIFGSPLI